MQKAQPDSCRRTLAGEAYRAAELRRRARTGSAVDAVVVAVAEPGATVLSDDAADINALATLARDVAVALI